MPYREVAPMHGVCPRCFHPLKAWRAIPEVQFCETCGGVMADNPASRRIAETLDRTLLDVAFRANLEKTVTPDTARVVSCPECLHDMQRVAIASAMCEVDVCEAHGTWFDAGELEAVMRAYKNRRARGASRAPAPPAATPLDDLLVDSIRP